MSVKIHANSRFIKQTQKTSRLSRSSHRESILCLLYSLSRSDRLNCKFQGLNSMQCKMYSEHNNLTILLLIRVPRLTLSPSQLLLGLVTQHPILHVGERARYVTRQNNC